MARINRRTLLGFETLESRHLLTSFFVDPVNGSNLQIEGSISNPFKTIERALVFADVGDVINLRAGVYREQVEVEKSGVSGNPITFTAYNNEEVLVTTTEPLTGWTQHSGDIYKATFDSSVFGRNNVTLFVDGQLMTEAHWSDLGGNIDTLDSSQWAAMSSGTTTTITDSSLGNMADDLWNGAFVWSQTSDFTFETRRVIDFSSNPSSGTLFLDQPFGGAPSSGDRFLIFDNVAALDAPGEWYFDESTNTIYLWAPLGGDPDAYEVEIKHREEAFDLNGHSHISIIDVDMRGGDLDMSGSSHILLQGSTIQMPDYGFGPEGSGGLRSLIVDGDYNTIRDNEFDGVHGTTVFLEGSNNEIINNYFHDIGYNNVNGAAVNLRAGSAENLISHNTITRVGRAAIGGATERAVIQYNDFSQVALTSYDVGAIYFANNSLGGTEIHHNVFRDISGDKVTGIYADNYSTDLLVHHNLMYDLSPWGGKINLPTGFMLWFNNTIYNSGVVDAWAPAFASESSLGSRFYNNIFSSLDADFFAAADQSEASNNLQTTSSSHFVSAATKDFRLVPGSAAVDTGRVIPGITTSYAGSAPDIGALELGESMFSVGHDFQNPPSPVYQWQRNLYSNFAINGGFELSLDGWSTVSGSPQQIFGNGWNYRGNSQALFGDYALELKPGDRISQTISDLSPNTTYLVRTNARLLTNDIQVEAYDGSSGSFTTETIRSETGLGSVDAGEWLRFDNIDFGSGSPLYDRVELGLTKTSALDVEVRVDDPITGQLLGTISVGSFGEPWFFEDADISAITGIRSVFLVFQSDAGAGVFDRLRFLDTDTQERVTLGAQSFTASGGDVSAQIGDAYWLEPTPFLEFTTGPNSTEATVYLEKVGGMLNGYVDYFTLTTSNNQPPPLLPGDFDGNGNVNGQDLPFWESSYGVNGDAGGDADFDGRTNGLDFLIWQRNFGVGIPTTLIDANTGNGSFEDLSGGVGAPEQTNANRVAAVLDNPGITDTDTATIPGWTSVVDRYLDGSAGNVFAGFDTNASRSSDGIRYAFANKRSRATLTSDPLTQHTTQTGDEFTLQFDTGSLNSEDADYIVRLIFGAEVRELGTFTEMANGTGSVAAYTQDREYTYTANAADAGAHPVVEIVINNGPNTNNEQWYVDDVRFSVMSTSTALSASAAAVSSLSVEQEAESASAKVLPSREEFGTAVSGVETSDLSVEQPAETAQLASESVQLQSVALTKRFFVTAADLQDRRYSKDIKNQPIHQDTPKFQAYDEYFRQVNDSSEELTSVSSWRDLSEAIESVPERATGYQSIDEVLAKANVTRTL